MPAKKPFYPISQYYQDRFGQKVRKISLNVGDSCPNRMGLKGMKTCVFCDEWGSAAYPEQQGMDLQKQIEQRIQHDRSKHNCSLFLAYFQSYTSTFIGVNKLRELYQMALSYPEVQGIIASTRADCVSESLLQLWNEISQKYYLSVEFGAQSFFDHHLQFLARGHDTAASLKAIERVAKFSSIDIGVHLIFGLPKETDKEIIQTAHLLNSLPIHNVKLHNLHVLKGTELEKKYRAREFIPLELEEYTRRVILFLQHLDQRFAVQRLAGLSSRWEELVAPEWTKYHLKTYQYIMDRL